MKKKGTILAIALLLCFIWGNSMLPGETSGAVSGGLLAFLKELFPFFGRLTQQILRKMGHFSEYAVLGALLMTIFRSQQGIHRVSMPLLFVMLAANIDETIQVLTPMRGPSVVDVWIDVAGACAGMAVAALILWRRKK